MHFRNGTQLITASCVRPRWTHVSYGCSMLNSWIEVLTGVLCKRICKSMRTDIALWQTNIRMCQSAQVNLLAILCASVFFFSSCSYRHRHIGLGTTAAVHHTHTHIHTRCNLCETRHEQKKSYKTRTRTRIYCIFWIARHTHTHKDPDADAAGGARCCVHSCARGIFGAYATSQQPRCLRAIALKINGKHFVGCQNCWSWTSERTNERMNERTQSWQTLIMHRRSRTI